MSSPFDREAPHLDCGKRGRQAVRLYSPLPQAERRRHHVKRTYQPNVRRRKRRHGVPAIAYDRRSAGAEAYWKVAMELVERS